MANPRIFGFWIDSRGVTRLGVAAIALVAAGAALLLVALPRFPGVADDPVTGLAMRALGWICIALGVVLFVPASTTLLARLKRAVTRRDQYWRPLGALTEDAMPRTRGPGDARKPLR